MTFEQLTKANEKLKTMDIKGKAYVQVNTRVMAFRELFPMGTITTDIIHLDMDCDSPWVLMKARVADDTGKIIGTGMAFEEKASSYINKTSFIENAETSAVGRALAMVGIGVDGSMCSAEELANAVTNQEPKKTASKEKKDSTPKISDVSPSREEMILVANKHYPEGSKPRESLLRCFEVDRIEDASDAQLYALWNKFKAKKDK